MPGAQRVDHETAFVLHAYPYRETSMIAELYTRGHGRVAVLARGARRPRAALRGLLLAFQPVSVSWTGKGELKTLMKAEWLGGQRALKGDALLCGFYLNELLLRLLAREDPHEALFDTYREALAALTAERGLAPVLRAFEKRLLAELGYAMVLDRDAATGTTIDPRRTYTYELDRGLVELRTVREGQLTLSGEALLRIAREDYSDASTLVQAKALMRHLINHRLESRPLRSRQVLAELHNL